MERRVQLGRCGEVAGVAELKTGLLPIIQGKLYKESRSSPLSTLESDPATHHLYKELGSSQSYPDARNGTIRVHTSIKWCTDILSIYIRYSITSITYGDSHGIIVNHISNIHWMCIRAILDSIGN